MKISLLTIWDNAYDFLSGADGDERSMRDYLQEQVDNGNITHEEAESFAEDVIDTYNHTPLGLR